MRDFKRFLLVTQSNVFVCVQLNIWHVL